jgi:hypothetical protein
MISYQDFKTRYLGQSMVGDNSANKGQCVGLFEVYNDAQGIPHVYGDAKDIYASAPDQYYDKLPADASIQKGDVFICGKPWGWDPNMIVPGQSTKGGYHGHIGFVDQPMQGQSFLGFEQNGVLATPNKVQLVFHQQRNGFLGFLRLKEEEMQVYDEQARVDWNLILYGKDMGYHSDCVGMEFKAAMYKLKESQSFKEQQYVNGGDISNMDIWLNRTDAQSEVGKVWKDVAYNYIRPNIPQAK